MGYIDEPEMDSGGEMDIMSLEETIASIVVLYFLHSILIAVFHFDTVTKNNLTYHIINATQTFLLGSNILTGNFSLLMLFITTAHANNKYNYYL